MARIRINSYKNPYVHDPNSSYLLTMARPEPRWAVEERKRKRQEELEHDALQEESEEEEQAYETVPETDPEEDYYTQNEGNN